MEASVGNWNVYIPQKYEELLEKRAQDDESVGQCIKRLVLELLDAEKFPDIDQRLSVLDRRVSKLESAIAKTGQPAIMIQKQPLPLAVEIQRTHEEAAQDWGKTLATVKRWAKDPDKWPEGWLWDGDKNFWVKEV
ncbi:hypothetical protein [Synechocystis sp. CACIAM 05]|uniref:hypothetical protein n=1 Tax=Synechocystis sp. CACIAM 05 TaxID=1933929 RepID=UPI00138E5E75|nr:hypothetical protein [Synechocystis sp. CACIAM 05]QHU99589.1 hypothetical protein BWK47_05220 [Synechocystis sp. CACIAM 05]